MAILQEAPCTGPELKTFDVSDSHGQIVIKVETSVEGWGAILQHDYKNKEQTLCRIENRL